MNLKNANPGKYLYSAEIFCLISLLVIGYSTQINAATSELNAPETELGLTLTDLDNVQKRLTAAGQLARKTGLGPQTAASDRAFSAGVIYYEAGEHLSTIREMNSYLNTTQITEPDKYLKAQYLLGRSHEATGNSSRALRAYLRYLSTFLTHKQPNYKELEDILHRMLPLAAKDSNSERKELDQFLSSVMNLDVPKEVFPGLAIVAARTAANGGHHSIASAWLERAIAGTDNPETHNRAVYLRAVIDIAMKDYESAENRLASIVSSSGQQTAAIRDLSRLALARVAVHRKKRDLALTYYSSIDELSPSFKDALFESIYLLLDMGDDKEARSKAKFYATRFALEQNAFQVRVLDLKAGDIKSASDGIAETTGELQTTSKWMSSELRNSDRITQTKMNSLVSRTAGLVELPPIVKEAHSQFSKLSELSQRLGATRGEIRNILFTIGRANIEHLRPEWVNRTTQLAEIGEDVLRIGHRLVAMERYLLIDQISPSQKHELEASEDRRTRLLTKPAKLRREMESWSTYSNFADLTQDLARAHADLQKTDAQIAGSTLHLESNKNAKNSGSRFAELESARAKAQKLREKLYQALEATRARKVQDLVNQSPHKSFKKMMTLYSMAINDEHELLAKVRETRRNRNEELLFADIDRAWNVWKETARSSFEHLLVLENDIKSGLDEVINDLGTQEARHQNLHQKLDDLTSRLEIQLGKNSGLIEDLYTNAINTRLAKHQKWNADLEWMGFNNAEKDQSKLTQKVDLERQILKDNLTDLQQGALWSWPE